MNALTIDPARQCFRDGAEPFVHRGTLDWTLFGRYRAEGSDVARAVIQDRRTVGANTIAFATMLSWGQKMHPDDPQWWEDLSGFCELLEEEGMRGQLVAFCDTRPFPGWAGMPGLDTQHAHWDRLMAHTGMYQHLIYVVANQPGHGSQTMTARHTLEFHKRFPHQLIAQDNPHEEGNPVLPAADFSLYCSSRKLSRYQNIGSSLWYLKNGWPEDRAHWSGTKGPVMLFECPRIEAGTQYGAGAQPSNGWDNPGIFRDLARSLCFAGTLGGNIYSRQGVNADLLTGVIRDCYVEFLGNIPSV